MFAIAEKFGFHRAPLDNFHWLTGSALSGSPYTELGWFQWNGQTYIASGKVGPRATSNDIAALDAIIRSLRFVEPASPSPPVGTLPALPVTASLHLPLTGFAAVADGGQVWIASYGRVFRVDPTTMMVTVTIPVRRLDDQDSIAAASGTLWVPVGSRGVVVAIDEATDKVIRILKIPGSG